MRTCYIILLFSLFSFQCERIEEPPPVICKTCIRLIITDGIVTEKDTFFVCGEALEKQIKANWHEIINDQIVETKTVCK